MSIIKISKESRDRFTILSNKVLRMKELSWEAKGLHAFFMSCTESYQISVKALTKTYPAGKAKVWRILRELIDAGLCYRFHKHFEGRIQGMEYLIFEEPLSAEEIQEKLQHTENQCAVFECAEKCGTKERPKERKTNSKEKLVFNNCPVTSDEEPEPIQEKNLCFDLKNEQWINISPEEKKEWEKIYPNADIELELLKATEWLKANPSKAKKKKLWRKFLLNWFDKANKIGSKKKSPRFQNMTTARTAQAILRKNARPIAREMFINDTHFVRLDTGERISLEINPEEFENQMLQIFNLSKS